MKIIVRNSSLVFQTAQSDADVQFTVSLTTSQPALANDMSNVEIPVGTYTVVCTPNVAVNSPLYFKTIKLAGTGSANSVRLTLSDGVWAGEVPIKNETQMPSHGFGFASLSKDVTIVCKMYKQS